MLIRDSLKKGRQSCSNTFAVLYSLFTSSYAFFASFLLNFSTFCTMAINSSVTFPWPGCRYIRISHGNYDRLYKDSGREVPDRTDLPRLFRRG